MTGLGNLIAAATVLSAAGAFASPAAHLDDAQYIAAAHCQGLVDSRALGQSNATAFDAMMKNEGRYRDPSIFDRADEARSEAMRKASRASGFGKAQLVSERDGACMAWTHAATDGGLATRAP